ncbi:MAG: large subunit ribosomal protein [Tenuifilum sp.]|jgi:large subunit ribosomal protein L29|uniref:Large ribosomal subunit protein uL29 n=1 Tax=Tenuifilum thalassicum TaxID=2590900 RepID=A0A7D4BT25_9BACT|nr:MULTISPECIES: 50S ribosomal protein L29 [Tenuifilum]MDI3526071.1 large subunit ribosomal protein [Tenuifilum sp.]QKG80841.1 50S ribosomal protein L29 [Tenuifilum thalassicum]
MKAAEIRELTDKEIVERIELEKSNLIKLRLNHSISPLDNPLKIKEARRNIARLKTILNQRKLSQNK